MLLNDICFYDEFSELIGILAERKTIFQFSVFFAVRTIWICFFEEMKTFVIADCHFIRII